MSAAASRPARWLQGSPLPAAAMAALAWLAFSIGMRPITLPEEGRYVGVAWEMLRSGNWLVPTQDGLPFFHKPPLFYWLTAASMQVFGPNAAAARFAPLLAAALGAAGLYVIGKRWVGERAARWSILVLVTEPFFFGAAQFANLDLLVGAFIALAILFAAHATFLRRNGKSDRGALVATWALAGVGVLAKGLIGIVLPGMVVLAWLLVTRQPRAILRLLSPIGIVAFLVVTAPWFIAVQMQYPGFARYFFVYQHFERFSATGFNNVQPWFFFIVAVPLLTLPWSLWLLRSTWSERPGESTEATHWRRLMWIWLTVVIVFFSIPQSKPVGYAMPVLFPIAALVADAVLARLALGTERTRQLAIASVAVAALVCLGAVIASSLTYNRDNTALARELLRLRSGDEPVVFVGEYFFDIPLHARLQEPVPVTGDWNDPKIALRDNWRRELAEAVPFAPALAATLLVDDVRGLKQRCGAGPLWAVVKVDAEATVAALPGAQRIVTSNRASLWRVPLSACNGTAAVKP